MREAKGKWRGAIKQLKRRLPVALHERNQDKPIEVEKLMAKKKKAKPEMQATKEEKNEKREHARAALQPKVLGAVMLEQYGKRFGGLDIAGLVDALDEQIKLSQKGNMNRCEAMLLTQAHTLDAIYNNLASRAINAELMRNLETYLKLGLKAQAQCRATLETLCELKQPRNVAFVKQANISNGPQQVNNAPVEEKPSPRTGKNKKTPNELLTEQKNGPQMDLAATSGTGSKDQAMETVGTRHRPENP